MLRVRHIAYATPNYSRAARQLRRSAGNFGLRTFIYTTDHPVVTGLKRRHPEIMAMPRGAGYWLWKPAIILDALMRSEEGAIIFYTDVAMRIVGDPRPILAHTADQPVVLFEHTQPPALSQSAWTKRDAFVLLGADRPKYWRTQQLWAGIQIYRNCERSRAFVGEVLSACCDERILTDTRNTQGLENLPEFRDHRHDQSVLTIIADRHGVVRFPDPSQHGSSQTPQIVDLHRKPDRGVFTKIRGRISKINPGVWNDCEVALAP